MNNTKIPDYVKSIDKLPKEHPFYGREKEFVKLMNDDLTKELPQTNQRGKEWQKNTNAVLVEAQIM